jgi:hypothetical protein
MPAGQPPVLNDADCAEICELIAAGCSATAVARLIGRNVKTIWRHAARDQAFGQGLRAAQRVARNQPHEVIRRAAASSPRAAAWLAAHPIIPAPQIVSSHGHSRLDADLCRLKHHASCDRHDTTPNVTANQS